MFFQTINCTFAKNIFAMSEEKWYVLGSLKRNQELKIRDELRRDNLDCFVPLRYVIKKVKGVRQRMVVPAIPGLMFLKGTADALKEAIQCRKYGLYLRKSTFSNKKDYLTVSNHDMQNFISFTAQAGEHISFYRPEEIQLRSGDKIRINGGLYNGLEGVIQRIKGKRNRQLIVTIPGVVFAAVALEPDVVELAGESYHEKPSKDIDKDKKLLFDLAKRLLFEIPEPFQHEKEYYLLLSELKRAVQRLKPIKAYLPSQEAELALPLYMASIKIQQDVAESEQRLRKAIAKLQSTSLYRLKAQFYLARFSNDQSICQQVEEKIASMKTAKLSDNQRALIDEYQLVFASST